MVGVARHGLLLRLPARVAADDVETVTARLVREARGALQEPRRADHPARAAVVERDAHAGAALHERGRAALHDALFARHRARVRDVTIRGIELAPGAGMDAERAERECQ